ncbi:MAG: hypothetical protein WC152_07555, partial [Candidatus Izemoplasmatales bacterium]
MNFTKLVKPILDSQSYDVSKFDNVLVYSGEISNEFYPEGKQKCFAGAWYHKVMSSKDKWLGIEGLVRLGEFTPDKTRFNLDGNGRFMDNPSVYMGGNALEESDAGLGLNLTYLSKDTSEDLNLSSPKLAYRPFWRYIYKETIDFKGNIERINRNSWNISEPRSLCYYYFPGDLLRMKIYTPIKNYLQLRIEVVETTKIEKYASLRESYNLPGGKPKDFYSPLFISEGHGDVLAEFKRVNSIDQYGNEGYYAKDTDALVSEAIWHETYLYREINGEIMKIPFVSQRQKVMTCPSQNAFTIKYGDDLLEESIQIHPGKAKGEQ